MISPAHVDPMRRSTKKAVSRVWTISRIVALGLIGLTVAGLWYIGYASRGDSVVVHPGAEAGDLSLEPCDYETEDGVYAADCGVLVVPERTADSGSRLIALPIVRVRSTSSNPSEPVFYLEGGPGITNVDFSEASRFVENRDVILVGYRGVDGSVRLDCPEVVSALRNTTDSVIEESSRAYGQALTACADRLTSDGVDVTSYGLAEQVDDIETARIALGYDRINLLSQSAGTRTAMIYGWRFPDNVHRSVMIGVNPPGHFLWDTEMTRSVISRYSDLCGGGSECSSRTDDLAQLVDGITADVPDRWLFLRIKEGNVRVASFYGLMESVFAGGQPSAPMTFDSYLSAAEGDTSGLWFQSFLIDLVTPQSFVWGQYASAGALDAEAAREYFSAGLQDSPSLGYAGSAFAWGLHAELADSWPSRADVAIFSHLPPSDVETLLIGGALDVSTPPRVAEVELLPTLSHGHQVILPWMGHTLSFFANQPEAGSHLINTFYDTGGVDDSLYRVEEIDFTPETTLGGLAKTVVGVLVGAAVLAMLSLLLMARRVRRRGGFGPKAGAVLRSIYPMIIGLGGWAIGALLVLSTTPGLRINSPLVVIVFASLPIGLGIYLFWVQDEWPSTVKRAGLIAATIGALVGGWLGFNVTDGLVALLTTIVAATAGANLLVITRDISSARSRAFQVPDLPFEPSSTLRKWIESEQVFQAIDPPGRGLLPRTD